MNIEYIIVQAGGKGTRLEYLTKNKPKALVNINNLPMIFHLFNKFPNAKYIIIIDYKKDVFRKYLDVFAEVDYILVETKQKGTCAGISDCLKYIPDNKGFMLVWSDLVLSKKFLLPNKLDNYLGISKDFECRWCYENNEFYEMKSKEYGVAGLFIFQNKDIINKVPKSGEFVKWLQLKKMTFQTISLIGTKEFGTLIEYNKLEINKCRSFNNIEIKKDVFIKKAISSHGSNLANIECEWYKYVINKGYESIPRIYDYSPLKMELIKGKNIYDYCMFSLTEKKEILYKIIVSLNKLHKLGSIETDYFSLYSTYIDKTFNRINKVRDLIPFSNNKKIIINGRKCRNIYFYKEKLISKIKQIKCNSFVVIHGDTTFSNMMVDNDNNIKLIDPRGYFGNTKIYGDINYDWAKLYYSIVGNYDQFNLKKFRLNFLENEIKLEIESNGFEELEDYFFSLTGVDKETVKLLHALIWLSLTTYTWEDYDSICAAFYNGLYYLEEVL